MLVIVKLLDVDGLILCVYGRIGNFLMYSLIYIDRYCIKIFLCCYVKDNVFFFFGCLLNYRDL